MKSNIKDKKFRAQRTNDSFVRVKDKKSKTSFNFFTNFLSLKKGFAFIYNDLIFLSTLLLGVVKIAFYERLHQIRC